MQNDQHDNQIDFNDRRNGVERTKKNKRLAKLAEKQARSAARRNKRDWLDRKAA